MTTTAEDLTVTLSTTCDSCEDWCDCYASDRDYFYEEILDRWLDCHAMDSHTVVGVTGQSVGWTRTSIHGYIEAQDILNALSLTDDYRLVFTLSSDSELLTATRYSHDEPVGSSFIFHPKR